MYKKKINNDYKLKCPQCGKEYNDDGMRLNCDICLEQGSSVILKLLKAHPPHILSNVSGFQKFQNFLPGKVLLQKDIKLTSTYKSRKFAEKFGFENLYFTCTGNNSFLGIQSKTCSFKELEAICVLHRLKSYGNSKPLVLSSAGNTARAFAYYGAKYSYPIVLIIPQSSRRFLWLPNEKELYERVKKYVRVVLMETPSKYLHASMLANHIIANSKGSAIDEGGFFNVGRVSGLGTCALDFYNETGFFPKHYFQAVGSGSGVLGALRSLSLIDEIEARKVNYHLIQNKPYDPLIRSINNKKSFSAIDYYRYIDTVCSPMLTSANPVLNYPGGLIDYINNGAIIKGYSITNEDIYNAHYEIGNLEKIQILLPAAAAVAGLLKAKKEGSINPIDLIQVNITGCGDVESKQNFGFFYLNDSIGQGVPEQVSYGGSNFKQWFLNYQNKIFNF